MPGDMEASQPMKEQLSNLASEGLQEFDYERRLAGKRVIEEQVRRQVRTFLDELRNGTTNYRTVASLGDQVAQEYRGRAVLELLQNAHDVLGGNDDPGQVSFVLNSSGEQPELLIANSGRPFRHEDFSGICELAQSPKDPNESVGNKGLGFRSVLELTTCPEIWSTAPAGNKPAFAFGFHPEVLDPIAQVAQALVDGRPATDPVFGGEPVVDWSEQQIEEYRGRVSGNGIKPVEQVKTWLSGEVMHLSPYVLPRPLGDSPPQVARLLEGGHVTVIRLPLDGGRAGSSGEAVQSVREQLVALDEAAMVFLRHLSALRITIDEDRTELKRWTDSERSDPVLANRYERLEVSRSAVETDDATQRSFHVWSRTFGGENEPAELDHLAAAVRHLPNRWPEVQKVEVAVAVEEAREAREGAFVIFLPTRMETGVGAHVNAPFYGSLDRKKIDFRDEYNQLLLELATDLALDAVRELVKGSPEPWRGRAVIDLLAQAGSPTSDDPELTRHLRERARDREDCARLEEMTLILCDGGWRRPAVARTMPNVPADDPFGEAEWRGQAGFDVASCALDERRGAVEALLGALDGSPNPTDGEWADTLGHMAEQVRQRYADAQPDQSGACRGMPDWNGFLGSVLAVLPPKLQSEPRKPETDALTEAKFLPTEDGRLLSASDADAVRIFFQPRSGADDAADFVGSVPGSLKERIAFLHHDVETHEGPQRRRTGMQKFLDGRFVQSFRRADLLRVVIVPSLPDLPTAHGSPEAAKCADALAWSLEVVGREEPEGLLDRLAELPVACTDGWFAMREAIFGPGWAGRSGEHLKTLADELPEEEGEKLLRSALLPPDDDRWSPQQGNRGADSGHLDRIDLANRGDQFARAGVVDGLRLEVCEPIRYGMDQDRPRLPGNGPATIGASDWHKWKQAVLGEVKPRHQGWFDYDLRGVKTLALPHQRDLGNSARTALSKLILVSLPCWEEGWDEVTIRKVEGHYFSQQVTSPLKHWLATQPWLVDDANAQTSPQDPKPLRQRWFVPESLLRGQGGRFRHLSPLSLPLAQRLGDDEELLEVLEKLGLNVYPTDDDRTGPALLEALADVAKALADGAGATGQDAMPAGGFDVLLGQIRHGWRHWDLEEELPTRFIVRTNPRTLTVRSPKELSDVYLPGHGWRTRLLREHGQPIIAMRPEEVSKKPLRDRLIELGARRAAGLEEHCLIDHRLSSRGVDGAQTLDAAGLGWLPVVLLALHAHGGGNPAGPATAAWRQAVKRLRGACVHQCLSIQVELRDGGRSVARSEPRAHWLSRERILVLRRDIMRDGSYEQTAGACQAILDRQDLLKDLRLVLGALDGDPQPTRRQIEVALDRAEIDAVAVADIRHRWEGETSALVHRIRPVLQLHGISHDGLDAAATDTAALTRWLAENVKIPKWSTEELLAAARECYDDFEMGFTAWRRLGDDAELPKWNEALSALGGKYEQVNNTQSDAQAMRYLDEALPLLRAFARHVATANAKVPIEDQGKLFSKITQVHEQLESSREWPRLCAEWSGKHWRVPFIAVLDVLRARFTKIPEAGRHCDVLDDVMTVASLRSALRDKGVRLDPDPREVARDNQYRFDQVVCELRECYEAWLKKTGAKSRSSARGFEVRLDASLYLRDWPYDDLLERAKLAVGDSDFCAAVKECTTMEGMRERLGITAGDLETIRQEHKRKNAETERENRTVEVAGGLFEIGGPVSYRELFDRLEVELSDPEQGEGIGPPPPGPDPGGGMRPSASDDSEVSLRRPKTSHLRGPPDLRELVGIVGEMHAFRFLRAKFGIDTSAWVSESRTKVVPLLDGEEDVTSDSLGYDFRFTHDQITYCVEVKATTGDGTGFELPSSEINAATRIAPRGNERWRILRVLRALTKQPVCYWLPNPFEPGPGEQLRLLRQGGVTVEYALPKVGKAD